MFASYENELKLVQADLNQKLDQIAEASGEQRKSAIANAEQVLDEATELVSKFVPEECIHALQDKKDQRTTKEDKKANQPIRPSSSTNCAWRSRTSPPQPGQK
jgi:ElaB/YqjD/DUF883 family membrane-anchored ribosome-binding protein